MGVFAEVCVPAVGGACGSWWACSVGCVVLIMRGIRWYDDALALLWCFLWMVCFVV